MKAIALEQIGTWVKFHSREVCTFSFLFDLPEILLQYPSLNHRIDFMRRFDSHDVAPVILQSYLTTYIYIFLCRVAHKANSFFLRAVRGPALQLLPPRMQKLQQSQRDKITKPYQYPHFDHKTPPEGDRKGVNRRFQAKHLKYQNVYISKIHHRLQPNCTTIRSANKDH